MPSDEEAGFPASGITTGVTRTLTAPDASGIIALLSGNQTFSGVLTLSNTAASLGTSIATASYDLGSGATSAANTKTINLGIAGVSGSVTVVNIGSTIAGALGQTIINTPTVTFAASVTAIGAAQANVSALYLGLGGATADAINRLRVNASATLLNNAGTGHEATINKAAAGNDAALAFKTGFSTRALFGPLGSDDFSVKVGPDGSAFFEALVADRSTGRVRFPVGLNLTGLAADPASPADGWIWHNVTTGQLQARIGGATRIIADQDVPWLAPNAGDYALTTTGAGGACGAATGTLAGAANRMDLFPFIPRDDITIYRLSVNVTTLIAAALGKVAVYGSDTTGRPASLILETGDLDFSAVGLKEATVSLTLRRGVAYWIGIRHSSTATLSGWASTATPNLNGGAPVTTARKVLRRALAYATPAPGAWGYLSSETNAGPGTAIWPRAA